MKIGVLVNNFGGFPETGRSARACVDLARQAERLGFDSVWVTDHVILPRTIRATYPHSREGFPYTWEQDIHEPLALMAALAEATARVEIGVSVLVIPYRHPLLTAKMLATIDQLSSGRIILGAGVGWLRDEFEALGLDPDHFEQRGAVTVEALRVMQAAWTAQTTVDFEGRYFRFSQVGARPRPARATGIPVWIGGAGERALRRSVAHGTGYLAIASSPEQLRRDHDRLQILAEAAGRDPASLTVSLIDGIVVGAGQPPVPGASMQGASKDILNGLERFAAAGLDHLIAGISRAGDRSYDATLDALEQVARDVLPAARLL